MSFCVIWTMTFTKLHIVLSRTDHIVSKVFSTNRLYTWHQAVDTGLCTLYWVSKSCTWLWISVRFFSSICEMQISEDTEELMTRAMMTCLRVFPFNLDDLLRIFLLFRVDSQYWFIFSVAFILELSRLSWSRDVRRYDDEMITRRRGYRSLNLGECLFESITGTLFFFPRGTWCIGNDLPETSFCKSPIQSTQYGMSACEVSTFFFL